MIKIIKRLILKYQIYCLLNKLEGLDREILKLKLLRDFFIEKITDLEEKLKEN